MIDLEATSAMTAQTYRPLALTLGALLGIGLVAAGQPALRADILPMEGWAESCVSDNPFLATTFFSRGRQLGDPAVKAFKDSANNSGHITLATQRQVGATWGLAYVDAEKALYAGAYHKRGTAFGPGGPGAIYRIDLASGKVAEWGQVPDAGADRHEPSGTTGPDTKARDYVGLTSLGDIDVSEDGQILFATNLFTRRIYRFRVADAVLLDSFAHGASGEAWAEDARPFGLKVWHGRLYHGVVNSAFASQDRKQMEALVYESALDGSGMRVVSRFGLDYPRGLGFYIRAGVRDFEISADWHPWKDGYNTSGPDRDGLRYLDNAFPQPMLSDIEFSAGGDMILGLRDRFGDMGYNGLNDLGAVGERPAVGVGDTLIGRRQDDQGVWSTVPAPEFYRYDAGPGLHELAAIHNETGYGGLGRIHTRDLVVTTALDPLSSYAGGAMWFDDLSGKDTAREDLYRADDLRTFGKANGLGDLELLCPDLAVTPTPTGATPPTATPTTTERPTPTLTPPVTRTRVDTPTALSTPTPSVTSTLTATLTPSATPTPYRIYLPFTEKSKPCDPDAYRTSVVLVLDRSTSMLRAIEAGGIPKNEAAIEAAKAFLSNLQLEDDGRGRRDQVAVVGFNDIAWIEQDLTSDRGAALAALDRIRGKTQEGTRLDLAFQWGQKPLDGPARIASNRPVVIILTDGLPNRVPFGEGSPYPGTRRQEDSVLLMANAVKATGSRVYTVALGTPRDILPWLMIDAASERWMYHFAPRPEDLAGIYSQIAATFNECRPKPTPRPCDPQEMHADIVLVLDMSTSMFRPTRGGRSKMEAAIAAAHSFAGLLDLERDGWGRQDQLGVVGFNGKAWTAVGLTDEAALIQAAIDGLPQKAAEGTRLDLALRQGQKVLGDGPRLQPNAPVLVLMTDGLPNQVPFGAGSADPDCPTQECVVLRAAATVKGAGTTVLAIGLGEGEDVLRGLLEAVATTPGDYFFAPDGEDLAAIYRLVAGRIQECPKAVATPRAGRTGR